MSMSYDGHQCSSLTACKGPNAKLHVLVDNCVAVEWILSVARKHPLQTNACPGDMFEGIQRASNRYSRLPSCLYYKDLGGPKRYTILTPKIQSCEHIIYPDQCLCEVCENREGWGYKGVLDTKSCFDAWAVGAMISNVLVLELYQKAKTLKAPSASASLLSIHCTVQYI